MNLITNSFPKISESLANLPMRHQMYLYQHPLLRKHSRNPHELKRKLVAFNIVCFQQCDEITYAFPNFNVAKHKTLQNVIFHLNIIMTIWQQPSKKLAQNNITVVCSVCPPSYHTPCFDKLAGNVSIINILVLETMARQDKTTSSLSTAPQHHWSLASIYNLTVHGVRPS